MESNKEFRECGKCGFYSKKLGRCTNGKINPNTIKGGIDAAQFMGIYYICDYCQFKLKITEGLKNG
jgi:Zn ribbon nucleic-acid-binding protein